MRKAIEFSVNAGISLIQLAGYDVYYEEGDEDTVKWFVDGLKESADYAARWAQSGRSIPCYGTTHADYYYGEVPCLRCLTEEEIEDAYELNTGKLIVDEFARMGKDPEAVSAVICKNHGPFAWGKDPEDAVHCAVVLEEVAKMAFRTELINPKVQPAPQELQDKHYYRKHGANAYYGQGGAK